MKGTINDLLGHVGDHLQTGQRQAGGNTRSNQAAHVGRILQPHHRQWGDELFVSLNDFVNYIAFEEEKEGQKLSDKDFVSAISISAKMREDFLTSEREEPMQHT